MQNKFIYFLIVAVVGVVLFSGFFAPSSNRLGGVSSIDAYVSTTTRSASASGTAGWKACGGKCVFGSIVVSQPGTAGWVRVWDATSTATSTYQSTNVSSTSPSLTIGLPLAQVLGSSDVGGTYVFDVQAHQGIVVETSTGFDGEYVVSWKK